METCPVVRRRSGRNHLDAEDLEVGAMCEPGGVPLSVGEKEFDGIEWSTG